MRNNQSKRMRGRSNNNNNNSNNHHSSNNHRKSQNPLTRVYESNGPDVKIRGNPSLIAEKYVQLARDAQSSGDPVGAENYFQHAEHYFRLIAAAQEQFRQTQPQFYRPENDVRNDDAFDGDDTDGMGAAPANGSNSGQPYSGQQQPHPGRNEQPYGTREPQPYIPRDAQPYPPREQPVQHNTPRHQPQSQPQLPMDDHADDASQLPSFITGGSQPAVAAPAAEGQEGQNGFEGQADRYPLHRRRRRHRTPRPEAGSQPQEDHAPAPTGE